MKSTGVGIILWLALLINDAVCEDFGYEGNIGPSHWGEHFDGCFGKYQSPININLLKVRQVRLLELNMEKFDDPIEGFTLKNNGHTVMLDLKSEDLPTISDGPLTGEYIFNQLHFHWGENNSMGSEDKINSKSFPMELHMVFYKKDYGDFKKALNHSDGLTVLAFFYELDRHANFAYDVVTTALSNVTEPNTVIELTRPISLLDLLPLDLYHYFTYYGSLTTPPCTEAVTWIDFEQPIRISNEQIQSFRELRSEHGKITHNFRPVQPLGDRVVFYNTERDSYYDNSLEEIETSTKYSNPRSKRPKNSSPNMRHNAFSALFISILLSVIKVLSI